ncbi:MAG TPA: hypothetical protein VFP53_09645, partial [Sphingomicrobium sp.]|nr:hypothetical protein [Sphingomicrobium sp.]
FRTVAFTIEPNGAQSVALIGTKDAGIVSAGSGDFVRPIQPDAKGDYYLTCFGRSCAGAVMRFTTTVRQPTGFTLIGSRPGLPPVAAPLVGERPRFARPQYVPDSTMTMSRIWL